MLRVIALDHIEPAVDGRPERIRSNAFHDVTSPEQLAKKDYPAPAASVIVESFLDRHGMTLEDVLRQEWDSTYGVASVPVDAVCDAAQGIHLDPTENNPAHALLFTLQGSHRSKGKAKALARKATIVIRPQ